MLIVLIVSNANACIFISINIFVGMFRIIIVNDNVLLVYLLIQYHNLIQLLLLVEVEHIMEMDMLDLFPLLMVL